MALQFVKSQKDANQSVNNGFIYLRQRQRKK
jgi:hypothetical protein